MDRLRQLINLIAARMGDLTVSQRVAIGLCAALVATSLLWLLQWSSAPELVALVPYKFSYEELDEAEETLRESGKPYEIQGAKIFVRAGDRDLLIRKLHSGGALPEGSLFDLGDLVAGGNPFDPPEQIRIKKNVAKSNQLAKIIATWPFVKSASVLINETSRRRIGVEGDVPTASVSVTLERGEEITDERVGGFARLIAGAVPGLKPHRVEITDGATGRAYSMPRPEDAVAHNYMKEVHKREKWLEDKIRDVLVDIPSLRVSTTVNLDADKRSKTTHTYNPPQPKVEDTKERETSSETAAAEPGLHANVGQELVEAGGGNSSSMTEGKTEYFPQNLKEQETVVTMPYAIRKVTATVGIPRSYIVSLYQARHPEAEEPTDVDLKADREAQVARVKNTVVKIVMGDPSDVTVDVYPDMKWDTGGPSWELTPSGMPKGESMTASATTVEMLRGYGPQVGLGVLALVGMFMMMRMVRKSASLVPEITGEAVGEGEEDIHGDRILSVGPHPVGEAERSDGMLTGHEVDEQTLIDRQLGEELTRMVEGDPSTAAELVKRWVEEED